MLDIVLGILHDHIHPHNISGVDVNTIIFYIIDKQTKSLSKVDQSHTISVVDYIIAPSYSLPSLQEDYVSTCCYITGSTSLWGKCTTPFH